jgi:hypothetical protein
VFTYNHSEAYVDLVLSIMRSYLDGEYTEVPDGLPAATFIPARQANTTPQQGPDRRDGGRRDDGNDQTGSDEPGTGPAPSSGDGGESSGGSPDSGDGSDPDEPPSTPTSPETSTTSPVEQVEETVEETTEEAEQGAEDSVEEVEEVLGVTEATARCRDKLEGGLLVTEAMIQDCGAQLAGKTAAEATALLSGTIEQVLVRLGLA